MWHLTQIKLSRLKVELGWFLCNYLTVMHYTNNRLLWFSYTKNTRKCEDPVQASHDIQKYTSLPPTSLQLMNYISHLLYIFKTVFINNRLGTMPRNGERSVELPQR